MGDRHGGTFHERQAAMLKLHLESKEESLAKRAKQTVWIEESQELFKKWHAPLKYIFNNYSKDFVSTRARSKDFTALSELSGGLTVGDWMIFCRDFRFVPHLMNKTQSLALFHLSNTELGVQDTELGARGGQQILSYNEFISCLRGVAMGEGFRTLPTMKERGIALGSFMRRQAYTFGPLKHSRPIDRFKGDTGSLKKRMGTCAVWERRCPLIEYVYMVPASLKFPDSLRIASEMVDLIASRACHIHTLTLCPVELEETEEEQEEAWAPKESKPVDPKVLDRLFGEFVRNQKAPPPQKKKKSGFGGSYVPPVVAVAKKGAKKVASKRRFGDATVGQLPLRHVHAAKTCIAILAEIADSCASGKARVRLEQVWEIDNVVGGEAIQAAVRKSGIHKYAFVGLQKKKQLKLKPKPKLHPKESEKADVRREIEHLIGLRKKEKENHKRKQRQEELKLIIEEQKKAKQAKLNADIRAKSDMEQQTKSDRKLKAKKKKQDDQARREEIAVWKKEKKQNLIDAKNKKNTRPKRKKKSTENMVGATAAARKHKQEMAQKKRTHLETKRELEIRAKFREKEARASKRKQDIVKNKVEQELALEKAAKSASEAAEVRAAKERAEAEDRATEAQSRAEKAEKKAQRKANFEKKKAAAKKKTSKS